MKILATTRLLSRLACGLLACVGIGWSAKPWTLPHYASATDTPYSIRVDSGIVYGLGATKEHGDKRLLMDAYFPEGPGLANYAKAAIIFMHPGSFTKGDRTKMDEHCRNLARQGVVAFTIDYRMQPDSPLVEVPAWQLENPESMLPPQKDGSEALLRAANAAFIDTKTALRYVHRFAFRLGVDTANIFLGGGSAGAVAALIAGVTPSDFYVSDSIGKPIRSENHPKASMSVRGIVDWSGGLYGELPNLGAGDPPIMIYHGDDDTVVVVEEAIRIANRCDSMGLDCEFHRAPDGKHLPWYGAPAGRLLPVTSSFVMRHIVSLQPGTAGLTRSFDRPRWTKGPNGSLVLSGLPESVRKIECVGLDGRAVATDVSDRNGVWTIRPDAGFSQGVVVRARMANGEARTWLVPMFR
jgi:acetyl esterase/lipase